MRFVRPRAALAAFAITMATLALTRCAEPIPMAHGPDDPDPEDPQDPDGPDPWPDPYPTGQGAGLHSSQLGDLAAGVLERVNADPDAATWTPEELTRRLQAELDAEVARRRGAAGSRRAPKQVDPADEDFETAGAPLVPQPPLDHRCTKSPEPFASGCPWGFDCATVTRDYYTCFIDNCGSGECPNCPPALANLVVKGWCTYLCTEDAYRWHGFGFLFRTRFSPAFVGPFCFEN